jgi:hypothetical protein
LLSVLNLNVSDLKKILTSENTIGRGTNLKNLSPFLLIIQSIIYQRQAILETYINDVPKKFKIILPKELQTEKLTITSLENIIKV